MFYTDLIGKTLGEWSLGINTFSIIFRLFLSFLLAGLLGCERSNKRHTAGLRTFIVVSVTSTMAMILDCLIVNNLPLLSVGIIVGLAFICTFSILMSSKNQIKGLTTAASLWSCSLLGISIGRGYYLVAFIGFILIYLCISLLPRLERYLKDKSNHFEIHLELNNKSSLKNFVSVIRELGMVIDDIESNLSYNNSGLSVYTISFSIYNDTLKKYKKHSEIIEALSSLEYVSFIEEIK